MQGWQVFTVSDNFFRCFEDRLGGKVTDFIQPEFFCQVFRLGVVTKGRVILIVVVNLEQRKNLIDCINQFGAGRGWFSLPSCGLRARR